MRRQNFSLDPRQLRLLSSGLSACLYAGWVMFRVRDQEPGAMFAAGAGQWLFSFAATFVFSNLIGRMVRHSPSQVKAAMAGAGAAALYAILLTAVHGAIGTAHRAAVVAPLIVIATLYAFGLASHQARHNARALRC